MLDAPAPPADLLGTFFGDLDTDGGGGCGVNASGNVTFARGRVGSGRGGEGGGGARGWLGLDGVWGGRGLGGIGAGGSSVVCKVVGLGGHGAGGEGAGGRGGTGAASGNSDGGWLSGRTEKQRKRKLILSLSADQAVRDEQNIVVLTW